MRSSLNRLLVVGLAGLAMVVGTASHAFASNILNFTQDVAGSTLVSATDNGTSTTITATNIVVDGNYLNAGLTTTNFTGAFLNFTLTSSGALTSTNPIIQDFTGTFSITSGTGGTGTDYLSGTFSDFFSGSPGGSTATVSAADPPDSITFHSDVITLLGAPTGVSLSFAAISPALAANGGVGTGTLMGGWNSSVTGTFNATTVPTATPEPASMVLFGSGLVGLAYRLKRRVTGKRS